MTNQRSSVSDFLLEEMRLGGGILVRGNGPDRINHYIRQLGLSGEQQYQIMCEVSTLTQAQSMDYLTALHSKYGRPAS